MGDMGLGRIGAWSLDAFDDYDQLMALAGRHGLGVVLSTIAEVQPQWIHRLVPDSEMVTRNGRKVLSSNRSECHFGLTPGGCTDHPDIWKRMSGFISATVTHFRNHPQLRAWDIWNELRWQVNAEDLVCYCPHTLAAFRAWLGRQIRGSRWAESGLGVGATSPGTTSFPVGWPPKQSARSRRCQPFRNSSRTEPMDTDGPGIDWPRSWIQSTLWRLTGPSPGVWHPQREHARQ